MKKRLKFLCWNCSKTYTLYREISNEQKLFAACPFCGAEAVVDLTIFPDEKIAVLRGENNGEQVIGSDLQLPEILPTKKPE